MIACPWYTQASAVFGAAALIIGFTGCCAYAYGYIEETVRQRRSR